MLDTNAVVALLRDQPPTVRERYREAHASGDYVAVSSVVLFELWYGVSKSQRVQENTERLNVFLSGGIDVLGFDDRDAKSAGEVRATLEGAGTPIGAYDLMIAGQALRRELTVVTANTSEFARIAGLRWEDWTQ